VAAFVAVVTVVDIDVVPLIEQRAHKRDKRVQMPPRRHRR
jgi:hypothetical protein